MHRPLRGEGCMAFVTSVFDVCCSMLSVLSLSLIMTFRDVDVSESNMVYCKGVGNYQVNKLGAIVGL